MPRLGARRIKGLHWDRRDSMTSARANEARRYDACRDTPLRPVVDAIETDVLILGARGARLCAALHAADRALARTESRGAHYRNDFPAPSAAPLYTVRVQSRGGETAVWTEPVALTRATPAGAGRVSSMVEVGD